MSRALATTLVLLLLTVTTTGKSPAAAAGSDLSQAELMLEFLEQARQGAVEEESLTRLLDSVGTQLVIAQMNLVRRVSRDQYAQTLRAVLSAEAPVLEPVDGSPRAARGVAGLTRNVWPVLRWGVSHTQLLRQRLQAIRALEVYGAARHHALSYLPPGTEVSAEVFVVMGGKAGAAALSGGRIYVDLLLLSYLEEVAGRPFVPEADLTDFIAHELHHLGLGGVLAARRESLNLSESEGWAYEVLSLLVSEGSASYLVSGHRELGQTLASLDISGEGVSLGDETLTKTEALLAALLAGEIARRTDFEAASGFFLGSAAHLAGALMLHRIDKDAGLERVMEVVTDPRLLLIAYSDAIAATGGRVSERGIERGLALAVARMGEPPEAAKSLD